MDPSLISGGSSSTLDGAVVTPYGTLQRASAELAARVKGRTGSEEDELGGDDGESLGIMETGVDSDDEDDEDDAEPPSPPALKGKGKKRAAAVASSSSTAKKAKSERDSATGRRKIRIEFIEDDSRRHITFSKRKAGIMKKAYELATLTGTQVLLLVVSQTGLVYTFTTPKLGDLVRKSPGKDLIRACIANTNENGGQPIEPEASRTQQPGVEQPAQPHVAPKARQKGGEQMPRETIKNRRATASNATAARMKRGGSGNSHTSASSQQDQLAPSGSEAATQQKQDATAPGKVALNYSFGSSASSMYGSDMTSEQTHWAFDGSMLPPSQQQQQSNQGPWSSPTLQAKQQAGSQQAWGR